MVTTAHQMASPKLVMVAPGALRSAARVANATKYTNTKARVRGAVGLANGSNPISIVIPCHRVIGSNGSLVGYGGGLPIKQALLSLERGQRSLL